jgi:hypothetical protein
MVVEWGHCSYKGMKIVVSVALSAILLAFLAIEAFCVNWDDPGSQTVDEMFAGDYGSATSGFPFPSSPQASRAAQAGEPNKEIINLPIGSNHSAAVATVQQTESQDCSKITTNQPDVANVAAQIQRPTSASGTWKLQIIDDTSRNATMTLFQSGETVFGKGEIDDGAGTMLETTASGKVASDKLTLDLVVPEKIILYQLSLTVNGDSASGSYVEFSTEEEPATGTVAGIRVISHS